MDKYKNQESNIIEFANNIKTNKNPFSILFSLAELKEIFISIGETLLNSIELNYSKKAREEYLDIFGAYKKEGIFEVTYDYYLNTKGLSNFKNQIDSYFEESFFCDISFFYFTIGQNIKFKSIFSSLELFYSNPELRKKYFSYDAYINKKNFLIENISVFSKLKYEKDSYFVVKFLDNFSDFNFELLVPIYNNGITLDIKIMKNITLFAIRNKHRYSKLYNLILETFVVNKQLYVDTIEFYEENKFFEVISFLRKELISGINIDTTLNYESKMTFDKYVDYSYDIGNKDLEDKLDFLLNKEMSILKLKKKKGELARIYYKRKILEKRFPGIIDLTLGIISLPQEVFYLFNEKNRGLKLENLRLYSEIKDLILYIDKSFYLNLMRPFLLKNIAHYFNSSDNKYYIIKFILCVILPSSYNEYKRISKFFYNLECFSRQTNEAALGRIAQFGWIYIILIGLLWLAPFGVSLAIIFYFIKEIFVKIIGHINPRFKMNLNFQLSTFASFFAIVVLIFSSTLGYKDNSYIFYNNFKTFINASLLPTKEVINIIGTSLIKADINSYYVGPSIISFDDIDYFKGPTYYDLKSKNDDKKGDNIEDELIITENSQENIPNSLSGNIVFDNNILNTKDYSNAILDKNNTIWNYGIEISVACNIDINDKYFNKKLSDNIEKFLILNKSELLEKLPENYKNQNINIWEIPKYLHTTNINLNNLRDIICNEK